jgi:ribosomal-protein-alanine N-acetyltransferase
MEVHASMTSDPSSRPPLAVYIGYMIRRDMPQVLAIEAASFEFPWAEEDFIRVLRQRNCLGMVVEAEKQHLCEGK